MNDDGSSFEAVSSGITECSAEQAAVNYSNAVAGCFAMGARNGEWKFSAIGDPTEDSFLGQTIHRIIKSYL